LLTFRFQSSKVCSATANFFMFLHRFTRYIGIGIALWAVGVVTVHASSAVQRPLRIDTLAATQILHADPVRVSPARFEVVQWQTIQLPPQLVGQYHVELWDAHNRPIPGWRAHTQSQASMDVRTIDASQYSSIKVVIFPPKNVSVSVPSIPIAISYTQQPNIRLFVFSALATLIFLATIASAIRQRIGLSQIWATLRHTIMPKAVIPNNSVTSQALIIILASLMSAFALGSSAGWLQILFVAIKLPLLYLTALCLSAAAGVVLARLMGLQLSVRKMLHESFNGLVILSVALAATSPINGFFSLTESGHDAVLIISLLCFGLAICLAIFRFGQSLAVQAGPIAWVLVAVWLIIYGVVLLQLGWLLRPWVGLIDPISGTIPFTRLYSGNVFVEVLRTFERYLIHS
jgi:hypothetical protein